MRIFLNILMGICYLGSAVLLGTAITNLSTAQQYNMDASYIIGMFLPGGFLLIIAILITLLLKKKTKKTQQALNQ